MGVFWFLKTNWSQCIQRFLDLQSVDLSVRYLALIVTVCRWIGSRWLLEHIPESLLKLTYTVAGTRLPKTNNYQKRQSFQFSEHSRSGIVCFVNFYLTHTFSWFFVMIPKVYSGTETDSLTCSPNILLFN